MSAGDNGRMRGRYMIFVYDCLIACKVARDMYDMGPLGIGCTIGFLGLYVWFVMRNRTC